MKVTIGPYKNWFGPYQLAEIICFWARPIENEFGIKDKPEWVRNFGEWLAYGYVKKKEGRVEEDTNLDIILDKIAERDKDKTWLHEFLLWVDSKRSRKIKIKIDKYDTWSMDSTLAHIILPMLKQLKETKHGAPHVDDKDVPKELRSTSAPPKKNNWDVDANHFKRWDWVLDEMIWSFEQKLSDELLDDYASEYKTHYKRLNNGFKLFGKYYQSLWD